MFTQNALRTRWAAIGAAVAVAVGAVGISGGVSFVQAKIEDASVEKAVYVPITPCRLMDTRPEFQVGAQSTPLGTSALAVQATGSEGDCTIPATATGIATNATAVGATAPTFLVFYPTGSSEPNASHLNPAPGQPPAPNAVNVDLNSAGSFTVRNAFGEVDLIVDIVGYYEDHGHDDYLTKPTSLIIDALAWRPLDSGSGWSYVIGWDHAPSGPTECVIADVNLPVGTTVTGAKLHSSSASADVSVVVFGQVSHPGFDNTGGHTVVQFVGTVLAAPGPTTFRTTTLPTNIADNAIKTGFGYIVNICTDNDFSFGSVELEVTYP